MKKINENTLERRLYQLLIHVNIYFLKVLYYIKFFASGIMSADDFEKKNGSFGSVAWPFIVGYNIISGPLKGIKKVGDVLIGN
jgi:hypothetical protein